MKGFIQGLDVTPEVNLYEGYLTEWETKTGNRILVQCNYQNSENKFLVSSIFKPSEEEVNEYFNNLSEDNQKGILDYTGLTKEEFLNNPLLWRVSDILSYCGYDGFENYEKLSSIDEVLQSLGIQ